MNSKLKNPSALQWAWQRCAAVMLCVLCTLLFLPAGCGTKSSEEMDSGADFFFNENGKVEYFKIRKDKVIIKTKSAEDAKVLISKDVFISAYNVGFWVFSTIDPKKTNLNNLFNLTEVIDVTYGLECSDGTLQYPTEVISINIKKGISPEEIIIATCLTEIIESIEYFDPYNNNYHITFNVKLGDILLTSRTIYESKLCEAASPVFFREMK